MKYILATISLIALGGLTSSLSAKPLVCHLNIHRHVQDFMPGCTNNHHGFIGLETITSSYNTDAARKSALIGYGAVPESPLIPIRNETPPPVDPNEPASGSYGAMLQGRNPAAGATP